jgi:hypothetical protein
MMSDRLLTNIAMDSQFKTLGQARRLSYEVYP